MKAAMDREGLLHASSLAIATENSGERVPPRSSATVACEVACEAHRDFFSETQLDLGASSVNPAQDPRDRHVAPESLAPCGSWEISNRREDERRARVAHREQAQQARYASELEQIRDEAHAARKRNEALWEEEHDAITTAYLRRRRDIDGSPRNPTVGA